MCKSNLDLNVAPQQELTARWRGQVAQEQHEDEDALGGS